MMPDDLEPGADEVRGTDAELIAQQWVADLSRLKATQERSQ